MHSTMNRGTAVREQGIAVARTVQADTVETSHEQKQDQVDPGTAHVSLANRAVATARVKLSHHVGLVTKVFTDTCVIKEQEQLINVYVQNWPKDPTGNFLPLEKWGEGHGTAFHQFQQYYADEGLSAIGASMNALVRAVQPQRVTPIRASFGIGQKCGTQFGRLLRQPCVVDLFGGSGPIKYRGYGITANQAVCPSP